MSRRFPLGHWDRCGIAELSAEWFWAPLLHDSTHSIRRHALWLVPDIVRLNSLTAGTINTGDVIYSKQRTDDVDYMIHRIPFARNFPQLSFISSLLETEPRSVLSSVIVKLTGITRGNGQDWTNRPIPVFSHTSSVQVRSDVRAKTTRCPPAQRKNFGRQILGSIIITA